ncbi:hypothetical protein [Shewanella halotolerans]|uniref:hypothetical protein n=1 Tax=Shewanella halotolerans TaxID=2864204 RepID=UPI001C661586|nr:hypothetical protein [Shewanella halotolerans]QYJ88841.1 hypothetical protein K0H81_13740 [Shewanella halotolerans]
MVGLGDIEAFFALKERYKKWRKPEPVVTNTVQRFIRLFEEHGVARAQIPRFFGHNLTIHQVEDEAELLKMLTGDLLESAAALFNVQLEWLEGASDELYELNHFYKRPKLFGDWLDSLLLSTDGNSVDGFLLTTQYKADEYDALILMRQRIGELSGKPIYRYHFCEQWVYGYWKCRADIAACVAQAWKQNCYVSGRHLKPNVFSKIIALKHIPDSELEQTAITAERFYAEDLTTNPESYVSGLLDGQIGIDSAIYRWLEYHEQGLMDSGFGDHRQAFRDFVRVNSKT